MIFGLCLSLSSVTGVWGGHRSKPIGTATSHGGREEENTRWGEQTTQDGQSDQNQTVIAKSSMSLSSMAFISASRLSGSVGEETNSRWVGKSTANAGGIAQTTGGFSKETGVDEKRFCTYAHSLCD